MKCGSSECTQASRIYSRISMSVRSRHLSYCFFDGRGVCASTLRDIEKVPEPYPHHTNRVECRYALDQVFDLTQD